MIELTIKLNELDAHGFVVIHVKLTMFGYTLINSEIGLNPKVEESEWIQSIDVIRFIARRANPDDEYTR